MKIDAGSGEAGDWKIIGFPLHPFCFWLKQIQETIFYFWTAGNAARAAFRAIRTAETRVLTGFQKKSFINRWFFDPRPLVDSASKGQGSKNHRFHLHCFWKSTISDAGSTRTGRGSKNHRFPLNSFWKPSIFKRNSKEIDKPPTAIACAKIATAWINEKMELEKKKQIQKLARSYWN